MDILNPPYKQITATYNGIDIPLILDTQLLVSLDILAALNLDPVSVMDVPGEMVQNVKINTGLFCTYIEYLTTEGVFELAKQAALPFAANFLSWFNDELLPALEAPPV